VQQGKRKKGGEVHAAKRWGRMGSTEFPVRGLHERKAVQDQKKRNTPVKRPDVQKKKKFAKEKSFGQNPRRARVNAEDDHKVGKEKKRKKKKGRGGLT